jgi:hypothetical protein
MIFFHTLLEFLRDKEYRDLLLTTLVVLCIGTTIYHFLEGWSWLDAFYFSFITLTTVGFGDFAPQTDAGKIFTILYIIIGIGIILSFVNTVYNHFSKQKNKRKTRKD